MSYSPSDGPPKSAKEKKAYNAQGRAGIDALNELMGGNVEKIEKTQAQKDDALLGYLRANIETPTFAVARRQGFKRVLGIVGDLTWDVAKIKQQAAGLMRERDGHKALATAIYGSATGRFTAEQISGHALLTDKQKQDCLLLIERRSAVELDEYMVATRDAGIKAGRSLLAAYTEHIEAGIVVPSVQAQVRAANSAIHDNERIG